MRTAEDIIKDYKKRGYSSDRLRALANGRAEPIRSQMLEILDREDAAAPVAEAEAPVTEEQSEVVMIETDEEVMIEEEGASEILPADTFELIEEDTLPEAPQIQEKTETESMDNEIIGQEAEEAVSAASDFNEADAYKEINNIMDNLSEGLKASHEEEEKLAAGMRVLAEIEVERISADEHYARMEQYEGHTRVLIDLRQEEMEAINHELEVGHGEHWPSVEEISEAEHNVPMASQKSSVLVSFEDSVAQLDLFDVFEKHKSGARSLEVLQHAMSEDPELAEAIEDEENVVLLNAPYAVADDEESEESEDIMAFTEDEVLVSDEQSSLISFPSDMIPMYEAINHTKDGNVLPIPANNGEFMTDSEIAQIELIDEDEAAAEVASVSADEFLSAVTTNENAIVRDNESAEIIEGEIAQLRNWLAEVEDALKCKEVEAHQLAAMIEDRDSTLAMQTEEISRLRDQINMSSESCESISEIEQKYEEVSNELSVIKVDFAKVQREYNILATETVPNLKSDKEDLLQVMEERSMEQEELRTALSSSGKRVAISYTLAAAASFLMVLVPVFHMISGNSASSQFETEKANLVAQLKTYEGDVQKSNAETIAVKHEFHQLKQNYLIDQQIWRAEEEKLKKAIEEKANELAMVRQNIGSPSGVPSLSNVRDANEAAGISSANAGSLRVSPPRNDGITNIESTRWGEQARANNNTLKTKVQSGEGIADVLLRKTGNRGDQTIWEDVARINNLKKSSRGYYIIHPGQELVLPASETSSTASIR
ncbi:MAG: hypothetical protein JXR97_17250 [Planctomycetes bacterium]|nr:hypothetical protein [Planctomycetota bacterium]